MRGVKKNDSRIDSGVYERCRPGLETKKNEKIGTIDHHDWCLANIKGNKRSYR